ncbi:MAG: outer membrane protein assembly factor BamA [Verrucomicrobia bacterium]|nr:outer membrane protein assembly factor BamA [Verrucomicrobiota bacterium]
MVLALAACGVPAASAQGIVANIILTNIGPSEVSQDLVRANIRTRVGEPYNRRVVDDDIRTLYATGYFMEVRVLEEPTLEGMVLTYRLKGRPTVTEIAFEGNRKYSRSQLLRKIAADFSAPAPQAQPELAPPKTRLESMLNKPLDERRVFFFSQEIRNLYQKKGYPGTEVRYVIDDDENTGRCTVTYVIKESPKLKIDDIYFEGARAFSQGRLRRVLKTRRHWWLSWLLGSGVLKDEQFEDDKDRLAEFYRSRGYIDFELQEVRQLPVSPNRITLLLTLAEGKQYKVGAIGFQGATLFPTNDLLKRLTMPVGAVFTPQALEADLDHLRDFYGDKGYIGRGYARAIPIEPHKLANTRTGTMDLVYELEEGEKSSIEKIEIQGNTKTRDRVIRRELAVSPGEVFDMVKVKLSVRRIEGMRLFEKVSAQPEPTDVPNLRNLVVSVDEKTTGRVSFGAGFSSVDSILGYVELAEENFDLFNPPWFRGGGQKVRLRAQYGAVRQDYLLTFIEPWFLGRKLQLSTDLYHRNLGYQSLNDYYDEIRTGGRVALTRALGSDYLRGTLSYTMESISLDNIDDDAPEVIKHEEGRRLVSKVGTGLTYDSRRSSFNVFLPDGGQRTELFGELAGGPFGAETDFYKLELRTSWYFKGLLPKHLIEFNGQIGVVDRYNRTDIVPLYDRWWLGGIDTLRGYQYREVGPTIDGEPIGGGTYWSASVEYSIPIVEILRFALFYDIGMVYQNPYSFNTAFSDPFDPAKAGETRFYNDNWGLGLRLNIPQIGPLRLDYGIPITADPFNDSSGRFQFSVGWTRDY